MTWTPERIARVAITAEMVTEAVDLGAVLKYQVEQLAELRGEPGDLLIAMVPRGKSTGFLVVPAEEPADAEVDVVPGWDWKQHHADQADKAVEHEIVERAMEEFALNMGFTLEGLPNFGLMKIASYAAQVARAQVLGFDPELLRLSDEEADATLLAIARQAVKAGKPTFVVRGDDVQRID